MKRYEFTLRPLSDFGTALKGDTLFGCFCWQVAYDRALVEGGLNEAIKGYAQKPFAVFSSAFLKIEASVPTYVLKRPDMPLSRIFPAKGEDRKSRYEELKELKSRRWMVVEKTLAVNLKEARFVNGDELRKEFGASPVLPSSRPHNTINRTTFSTGSGAFAPYEMETFCYTPDSNLAVVVLVDEDLTTAEEIRKGLERIGRFGFGRDASIGLGRFHVVDCQEIPTPELSETDGFYTLAPCVPESGKYKRAFFSPFIRFGKHGDRLARGGVPFKNPVIMADEGSVFFKDANRTFDKPYIGKAVEGVSKIQETTVVQGYSPYLPITLE
ncbi:MAG: type III-A CRISPR-associated RAMP protein Csm4 [Desulfatiglandales bacterium]